MLTTKIDLKEKLKEVFGYNQFRGPQEDIINSILANTNTFVLMPTGAGKSLCYQLPAVISEGTAIVISPLIALMKNQVDQLNALGINARFLNSTLNKGDMNRVKKDVLNGETKLLYVAPESLTKESNAEFLAKANISFIAIDEAHCISEWGHDFRPEYRKIRSIVDNLGDLPIIALTATATPKVQLDIKKNLRMEEAAIFKTSFNRSNLFYDVRPKVGTKKQLVKYLRSQKNKSGIVYCISRKKVEEISEFLRVNDVNARPYHAGLDASVREKNQDAFLNEEVDVIVATIAFGMGIDKPDVRFVIHYDAPKSLEGYYQETGRAGRDGMPADCIMFFSPNDIQKLEKFNKDKPVTERDNAKHLLQEVLYYAISGVCRRRQLLHYFGESYPEDCGYCSNCRQPNKRIQVKDEVFWALRVVQDTGERFPISHLIHVLVGDEKSSYVQSYDHSKLELFGKGKGQGLSWWHTLIRQALLSGLLARDKDNVSVIKLTEKGRAFLEAPYFISLVENHDYSKLKEEDEEEMELGNNHQSRSYDPVLFDMLKALRKKIARQKGYPPYAIFQDPSL
ncbi:MAG: DNA helicase RecQ, partial [Bacteroidota bacterium]